MSLHLDKESRGDSAPYRQPNGNNTIPTVGGAQVWTLSIPDPSRRKEGIPLAALITGLIEPPSQNTGSRLAED